MTEYLIDLILQDLAVNAESQDYTERVMNKAGNAVICTCLVTSQVHGTEYPRYSITWKTSQEAGYIQAAYHFKPKVGSGYMRVCRIYTEDDQSMVEEKLTKALLSGLKRGKAIYDGDIEGPYDESYVDPNTEVVEPEVVEPTPIEVDHSVSLVEVDSIDLLDTEEAPIMVLEEYVTSDADVDESEEWTGFYGLPDFANWIDFEIIKIHADAPQAEEMAKIFDTTIDLARFATFYQHIYIKIGDAACYGEAELQYWPGFGFYVVMKSINYFVGDPEAVEGDDLFLAADGNIYSI